MRGFRSTLVYPTTIVGFFLLFAIVLIEPSTKLLFGQLDESPDPIPLLNNGRSANKKMELLSDPPSKQPQNRPVVTLWHNDAHIGPIGDLMDLFSRLSDVEVRWSGAHNFGSRCRFMNDCVTDPKVLSVLNFSVLHRGTAVDVDKFFRAFKDDPAMTAADAFICSTPASLCRFFLPFNKPIIAVQAMAWIYSANFASKELQSEWLEQFQTLLASPSHVVTVNNDFHREDLLMQFGVQVKRVFNLCKYTNVTYSPAETRKHQVLVNSATERELGIMNSVAINASSKIRFVLAPKNHQFSDLAEFPVAVFRPKTVSEMTFYEWYTQGTPMFLPNFETDLSSPALFRYNSQYVYNSVNKTFVTDWSFRFEYAKREKLGGIADPWNIEAQKWWANTTDYVRYPHLFYYRNYKELVSQIEALFEDRDRAAAANDGQGSSTSLAKSRPSKLLRTSQRMQEFSEEKLDDMLKFWGKLLRNLVA